MARSADPNSAGSQFFICLGTASSLDHQYTAFGKVIKGLDVLDKIGDTPVGRGNGGEMSKPQHPRRARERENRAGGFGEVTCLTRARGSH